MDYELRYTVGQVPRGSRPDGVDKGNWYLIKHVPLMRLTYQVQLLALMARQNSARLVLVLPPAARLSEDLQAFARASSVRVQRMQP